MRRSVQGMLEELEYNLWEHILCRLVDYGHAFSPEVPLNFSFSGSHNGGAAPRKQSSVAPYVLVPLYLRPIGVERMQHLVASLGRASAGNSRSG